jgi:hypothetical protein
MELWNGSGINSRRVLQLPYTPLPVIFKLVLTHSNSHYVDLADVMQTLMCFYRWQQHLHETPSLTPTALVNPGGPRCVRKPAIEDVLIAALEWKLCTYLRLITRGLGSVPLLTECIPISRQTYCACNYVVHMVSSYDTLRCLMVTCVSKTQRLRA